VLSKPLRTGKLVACPVLMLRVALFQPGENLAILAGAQIYPDEKFGVHRTGFLR